MRPELRRAEAEVNRLQCLFECALWYNFEQNARRWSWPWHMSYLDSDIHLHGMIVGEYEIVRHTTWFAGMLRDAPPFPLQILVAECDRARAYVEECREHIRNVLDYAPGGRLYQEVSDHFYATAALQTHDASAAATPWDGSPARSSKKKRSKRPMCRDTAV